MVIGWVRTKPWPTDRDTTANSLPVLVLSEFGYPKDGLLLALGVPSQHLPPPIRLIDAVARAVSTSIAAIPAAISLKSNLFKIPNFLHSEGIFIFNLAFLYIIHSADCGAMYINTTILSAATYRLIELIEA